MITEAVRRIFKFGIFGILVGLSEGLPKDGPSKITDEAQQKVVIIGGGVSGMTTGVLLSDIQGLSVTLLEGDSRLGGVFRTLYTSPAFYYPSKREDMAVLDQLIGNTTTIDNFYNDLVEAVNILEEKGVIKNKYALGFDNYIQVEGTAPFQNTMGLDLLGAIPRALTVVFAKFEIWLGSDFWYHALYRMKALFNLVEISDQLKTEVGSISANNKLQVKYNSRVAKVHDHEVTTENGDVYPYDYLVFASGGTGGNPALQKQVYGVELQTHEYNKINTGIALKTAVEKGWSYNKELFAWYAETVQLKSGDVGPVLFQPGPSVMTVNRAGKRVYNEKRCYNERGRVTLDEKELLLITDKTNIQKNTPGVPAKNNAYLPKIDAGEYLEAENLTDLIRVVREHKVLSNLSEDFESNLLEQWGRYHGFVESGVDLEFKRGNDPGEVLDGGDPTKPPYSNLKNKALAPIDEDNLVAIRLSPSSLDTCSGPTVDQNSRVQKIIQLGKGSSENVLEPIPNVFATGNAAEAILGGHYTAGGVPVSSGIVGAYRIYKTLTTVNAKNK